MPRRNRDGDLGSPISIVPIRYHPLRLRPPRQSPTFPQKSVPSQVAKSEGATAANYGSALILIPGGNEQSPILIDLDPVAFADLIALVIK